MNETILKVIASLQSNTSELRSILNFNENERHYIYQAMRDIQQAVDFLNQVGTPLKPDEQFLFGGSDDDWENCIYPDGSLVFGQSVYTGEIPEVLR
ncbi:MAG: hypothetical protein IJI45_03385 [Anaerolineaceae bacterium]|nr:hypothetical protein [Anaerolineaceae bacterium]